MMHDSDSGPTFRKLFGRQIDSTLTQKDVVPLAFSRTGGSPCGVENSKADIALISLVNKAIDVAGTEYCARSKVPIIKIKKLMQS